jgi:nitrogen regulatory protein P-II 1
MKRVEAIIPPLHLEEVKDRLRMIGVPGMTIQMVRGSSRTDHRVSYRGTARATDLVERVRLDVVVVDDMAESIANAIITVMRRSDPADGLIFISPVDDAIRIRTGESGPDAL